MLKQLRMNLMLEKAKRSLAELLEIGRAHV